MGRKSRESDRYRGKRRAPTPPRGRFSAALATAFLCAAVTAFAAGQGMSDQKPGESAVDLSVLSAANDRAAAAGSAVRSARDETPAEGGDGADAGLTELWRLPLRGYKVTAERAQRSGRVQAGIDLAGIDEGAPVGSVADGVVMKAGREGSYGNIVRIDHGHGQVTVYGHNSEVVVTRGQQVKAGDIIAKAGTTGYSFTPHVHLEIWVDGHPTDPVTFFRERGVDFFLETEAVFGIE
jgi:murein DD-endopeptidase MepM/ murein hydrolase activator NlpD